MTTKELTIFVPLYYFTSITLKMAAITAETCWWKFLNKLHLKHWSRYFRCLCIIQYYLLFFSIISAIWKRLSQIDLNWSHLLMKGVGISRIFFKPKPLVGTGNEGNRLTLCVWRTQSATPGFSYLKTSMNKGIKSNMWWSVEGDFLVFSITMHWYFSVYNTYKGLSREVFLLTVNFVL